MNLDLLIKLVKLANNNPNDNEANSAARRVCKMIAEADYKFGSIPQPKPIPNPPTKDWMSEILKNMRNMHTQDAQYWERFQKEAEQSQQESYTRQAAQSNKEEWSYKYGYGPKPKPPKPKKILKCCICGKDVETAFVGPPQVYRCLTCDWTEYEKQKVK